MGWGSPKAPTLSPVTSAWSQCGSGRRWPVGGCGSPRAPARAPRSSSGFRTNARWPNVPPERAPITVLLVEDHLLVAEGLASLLNASGYVRVVGTTASAVDASRVAAECQPDVVVMDSHLPDGSGADAAMRLREEQPRVPIVFLSADESEAAMIA